MLVFSVLGFLASELRSLVLHPDRFFQRFRFLWKKLGNSAELKYRDFHRAVLSCDLRRVKRLFARITPRRAPLDIRVKNLVSKRYIWDTPRILQGFFQLRQNSQMSWKSCYLISSSPWRLGDCRAVEP